MSKIYLGLSGGVDSAVSGYLLKKRYPEDKIVAVHAKFSDNPSNKTKRDADPAAAREIADHLEIDFEVVDLSSIFEEKIISNYLDEYRSGRTPNPCVVCNREIKFGLLKERLLDNSDDKLAMGHYVRLKDSFIYRGIDRTKDQSYFLWSLNPNQLDNLIFPLGNRTKKEVKEIAQKIGLSQAFRPESSGACFFPKGGHRQFVEKKLPQLTLSGEVTDKNGKAIGTHQGVGLYTIGQRYGFEIDPNLAGLSGKDIPPLYVVDLRPKTNRVVVGREEDLHSNRFAISETNWFLENPLDKDNIEVQIRHLGKKSSAQLAKLGKRFMVTSRESFRSLTPGQSAVFYQGDLLVGGGIIDRVIKSDE